jgi:hypothetical protein
MTTTYLTVTASEERLDSYLLPSLLPQLGVPNGRRSWSRLDVDGPMVVHRQLCRDGEVLVVRKADGLAAALAFGEQYATGDRIVTLHDDTICPPNWVDCLTRALDDLDALDPAWGVFGIFGTLFMSGPHGATQEYVGNVVDRGTGQRHWFHPGWPLTPVESVDSLCVVKRRGRLAWDAALPGFAGGSAEDLCCQAHMAGMGVWAAPLYTEHHGTVRDNATTAYDAARDYVLRKWARPVLTTAGYWTPTGQETT